MDGLKHVKPWIIKGRKYPKQGEIIKSFRSCNVTHVSRGGNWVAHMLARRLGAKLWSVVGRMFEFCWNVFSKYHVYVLKEQVNCIISHLGGKFFKIGLKVNFILLKTPLFHYPKFKDSNIYWPSHVPHSLIIL